MSVPNARAFRKNVRAALPGNDVLDGAVLQKYRRIRNEPAVATPPNRLGAHDDRAFGFRIVHKGFKRGRKLRRFHVICVCTKRFVTQSGIFGIRVRAASPTEIDRVAVRDTACGQGSRECLGAVLRIVTTAGKTPNVNERYNCKCTQRFEKRIDRRSTMSNRVERHRALVDPYPGGHVIGRPARM